MVQFSAHLTPKEGDYCEAIKEFFAISRGRRSKTTYKATLAHFTKENVEIWITLHQLSVWNDSDYVGKKHLRRGHIVEKHYIKLPNDVVVYHYQDFGAHPKFAKLDQRGFPEAQRNNLEARKDYSNAILFAKESGSMNIAVFPPQHYYIYLDPESKLNDQELYRQDRAWTTTNDGWHISSMFKANGDKLFDVVPTYSYSHPMTHYVTSKNGWDNKYARAGDAALRRCLEARGQTVDSLQEHLHASERTTIVYELMHYQEHVYIDSGEELYVHLVDRCPSISLEKFMSNYLPVVRLVGSFPTIKDALLQWERDNTECQQELEGYVLVVPTNHGELKIKLKFWRYLVLREFRKTIKRNCCPTREELFQKYNMWDMPTILWDYYASRTRKWYWWTKSPLCSDKEKLAAGEYIAIRDQFLLNNKHTTRELLNLVSKEEPVMIYFVLVGVQCIGKSRYRQVLSRQYPGFVRSQDECGGYRNNLIKEISKWAETCKESGLYSTIIDRCNFNWEQRRTLFNVLEKIPRTGFVYTINITAGEIPFNDHLTMLFERFLSREGHPSFSPSTVGAIKGLEILRDSLSSWCPAIDGVTVTSDSTNLFLDMEIPVKNFVPVEYEKYGVYSVKTNKKFVYGGIALPNIPTDCCEAFRADPTVKKHGTHVTLVYGKDNDPLPEGDPVEITVFGWYRTNDICGLLVTVPGYTTLKHITMYTCNGVTPGQSDVVIEKMFGKAPEVDSIGSVVEGVKWIAPYKLKGWYGNYYT